MFFIKRVLWIVLILALVSCSKPESDKLYTVKAGNHYSGINLEFLDSDIIGFKFSTDSSWIWKEPVNNGFSKVLGIAWDYNHKNSVRVVYLRSNDIGLLGAYYYVNGVSPQENPLQKVILDTIKIGKTYYGNLGYSNGWYHVSLGDRYHSYYIGELKLIEDAKSGYFVRLRSNLYIGGTYTIDHDWNSWQRIWEN